MTDNVRVAATMTDDRRQRAHEFACHELVPLYQHGEVGTPYEQHAIERLTSLLLAFADAEAGRKMKPKPVYSPEIERDLDENYTHEPFQTCPQCGVVEPCQVHALVGSKASAPRKDAERAATEAAGLHASFDPPIRAHRCPVCNGNGQVPLGFYSGYHPPSGTSSIIPPIEICRACFGKGILWR